MAKRMSVCVLFAFAFATMAAVAGQNLRIAGNLQPEHSSSRAMEIFKTKLAEYSGGEMTADIFPGLQLGGAAENVDQVRNGTIFATWLTIGYLSRTVPELEAVSLPFLFPDRETAFRIMDGKIGELLNQKLQAKGFQTLSMMEAGARHVTNNLRPIKTAADFKGMKIRLQPNQTHIDTFKALGASPVAMDVKELYQAMQQNVLDGQENPYALIRASKYYEIQKYLSNTGHFFDFVIVAGSKRAFDKLSDKQKEWVTKAMADATAWQRQTAVSEAEESLKFLIDKGMVFTEITPEAKAEMRQLTAGVADLVRQKAGKELVDEVIAEANK